MSIFLLVDNGSLQAAATLQLQRLAEALGERVAMDVHPVSLMHADRIPVAELEGQPADTLKPFLAQQLANGQREFILIPLFFGNSRALTSFIPQVCKKLEQEYGRFDLAVRDVVCPLPKVEPALVRILHAHAQQAMKAINASTVVLVDHGSPLPQITAVREHLAAELQVRLPVDVTLHQAVMERREGREYDFNGSLLADYLDQQVSRGISAIAVVMLFFLPGRHAGPDGDVMQICEAAMQRHPDFKVSVSPLVGEHSLLLDILEDRLRA